MKDHAVFLSDYDMLLTQQLVKGVDVWINTPRRPWEASGTSGMKVLANGGLNLSELDGWWAEANSPDVGWALGDGNEHENNVYWDDREARELYNLLENEIIPEFYDRNEQGIPVKWVNRIRESMALLTPEFSANRAVREYTEKHYIPRAHAFKARAANDGFEAKRLIDWKNSMNRNWAKIHFGGIELETTTNWHMFGIEVYLGSIDPDSISVELYADGINGGDPVTQPMQLHNQYRSTPGNYKFSAKVSSARPASDYTIRVVPCYEGASVPLEAGQILWQK